MSTFDTTHNTQEIIDFRRGLLSHNLCTRRFGRVTELLIQRVIKAQNGRNVFHDLYLDSQDKRVEVKFSVVRYKHSESINPNNLIAAIKRSGEDRTIPFDKWEDYKFDSNIQQIKTDQFEILYYGLFFSDMIMIFKIDSQEIKNDPYVGYCNIQHKGNAGEGQFHITPKTLPIHLIKYFYKQITYDEFYEIVKENI